MGKGDLPCDPRGLIFEAYRMDIDEQDARTIFLDWALGLDGPVRPEDVQDLLDRYAPGQPDHPMTAVLRAGLQRPADTPSRRRGRRRRALGSGTGG